MRRTVFVMVLTAGVTAAVAALTWTGARASREWRRSSVLLVERRVEQQANLLARMLARDMRAAEESLLRSLHWDHIAEARPYEIAALAAAGFVKHPYAESFFAWSADSSNPPALSLVTRGDRPPSWLPSSPAQARLPIVVSAAPPGFQEITDRLMALGRRGRQFTAFETQYEGVPYQVVVRLLYRGERRDELHGLFGFMVDLSWARSVYFPEQAADMVTVIGDTDGLTVALVDSNGALVAGELPRDAAVPTARQAIAPLFFDPDLVALDPPGSLPRTLWTLQVSAVADPTLMTASRGSTQTLVVVGAAALTFGAGLLLTLRAQRSAAELATVRADFVTTVTHDLKTPLAAVRMLSETLVRGRLSSPGQVHEYVQMLDQEAKRMTRLVDNLLAYARVTDAGAIYTFEPLAPADVIDDVLHGFRQQFGHREMEISIDIPEDLPLVRADLTTLSLVLDNIIDNALRYSPDARWLSISARRDGDAVEIAIGDRGVGIPADEIEHVTERFVRGRQSRARGTGLGLAIAARVMHDHGGRLAIESTPGVGTTVRLSLPLLEINEE